MTAIIKPHAFSIPPTRRMCIFIFKELYFYVNLTISQNNCAVKLSLITHLYY